MVEFEAKRSNDFKKAVCTMPFNIPMEGYEEFLLQDSRFAQLTRNQVGQTSQIVLGETARIFLYKEDDIDKQRRIFGWGNIPDQAEGVGNILTRINPLLANESFRDNPVLGFEQLAQTYLQCREIQLSTARNQKSEIDEFIENDLKIPANNHEIAWFLNFWALGEQEHYKTIIFPVAEILFRHSYRIVEPYAPSQNQTVALASLALSDASRILWSLNSALVNEVSAGISIDNPEEGIVSLILSEKMLDAQYKSQLLNLVKRNIDEWINIYCLPNPLNPFESDETFNQASLPTEDSEKDNPMHISGLARWLIMYHYTDKSLKTKFDTKLEIISMLTEMVYQIHDKERIAEFMKMPEIFNYQLETMHPSYGDVRRSIPIRDHYRREIEESLRKIIQESRGSLANPLAPVQEEDKELARDIFKLLIKNVMDRNIQRSRDTLKAMGLNAGAFIPDNWESYIAWGADKSFRSAYQIVSDTERFAQA